MTVIQAIQRVDNIKPNTYMQEDKIRWLSEIDGRIKKEIIDTHWGNEFTFNGYTENDINTELIVPAPYDDLYVKWLETQIDYSNNEYGKYNNSMAMFNAKYGDYSNYYNRTHMPKGRHLRYW